MALNLVKFNKGTQAAIDKLKLRDENTLYFSTDKGRMWLGDIMMGSTKAIDIAPESDGSRIWFTQAEKTKLAGIANKANHVTAEQTLGLTTATKKIGSITIDSKTTDFYCEKNTDTKVTSVENHYKVTTTPTNLKESLSFGADVITGVATDAAGHLTGYTIKKLPAKPADQNIFSKVMAGSTAITADSTATVLTLSSGSSKSFSITGSGKTATFKVLPTPWSEESTKTGVDYVASTEFVKSAIDAKLNAADAMQFKGVVADDEAFKNAVGTNYQAGWTYKVSGGTEGVPVTIAGKKVSVNDMIVAVKDCASKTYSADDFSVIQGNLDGAVTGPKASTAGHIATFTDTTGTVIKDSGKTIAKSVPETAVFTTCEVSSLVKDMGSSRANAAVSNPYLYIYGDEKNSSGKTGTFDASYTRFVGGSQITVKSDAAASITFAHASLDTSESTGSLTWGGNVITGITYHTNGHLKAITTAKLPTPEAQTYTTKLYIGDGTAKNTVKANPILSLWEKDDLHSSITFNGDARISINSTAAGAVNITTDATKTEFTRNLSSGTKIGTIKINGTATDLYCEHNTNTHDTAHLFVGNNKTAANQATANNETYLTLADNDDKNTSSIKVYGSTGILVTSSMSGDIHVHVDSNYKLLSNDEYNALVQKDKDLVAKDNALEARIKALEEALNMVTITESK